MLTPPQYNTYLPEETLIIAQIVEERFWYNMALHQPIKPTSDADMQQRSQVIKSIIGLMTGSRLYVAINQRSLQRIWDVVRSDEKLTDAILELTVDFTRRCLAAGKTISSLIDNVAEAYGTCAQFGGDDAVTVNRVSDTELYKTASTKQAIVSLLNNNVWFVMLLAMEPLTARL